MDDFEFPICPMCGAEYSGIIAKPIRHAIDCPSCGEQFEVEGNPEAAIPEFRRPFWTDQFRPGKDDSQHTPAALDGLMIAFVVFIGIVAAAVIVLTFMRAAVL